MRKKNETYLKLQRDLKTQVPSLLLLLMSKKSRILTWHVFLPTWDAPILKPGEMAQNFEQHTSDRLPFSPQLRFLAHTKLLGIESLGEA